MLISTKKSPVIIRCKAIASVSQLTVKHVVLILSMRTKFLWNQNGSKRKLNRPAICLISEIQLIKFFTFCFLVRLEQLRCEPHRCLKI